MIVSCEHIHIFKSSYAVTTVNGLSISMISVPWGDGMDRLLKCKATTTKERSERERENKKNQRRHVLPKKTDQHCRKFNDVKKRREMLVINYS